jgi:hypothetical protein
VNNANAIYNGGLAGNPRFFGSATAEIVSIANQYGSWNGDYSRAHHATESSNRPWSTLGGQSNDGIGRPGTFAFYSRTGNTNNYISHRTILSGY